VSTYAEKDFVKGLSISCRGSIDEKLSWTFRLYDQDNDGYMSKEVTERPHDN